MDGIQRQVLIVFRPVLMVLVVASAVFSPLYVATMLGRLVLGDGSRYSPDVLLILCLMGLANVVLAGFTLHAVVVDPKWLGDTRRAATIAGATVTVFFLLVWSWPSAQLDVLDQSRLFLPGLLGWLAMGTAIVVLFKEFGSVPAGRQRGQMNVGSADGPRSTRLRPRTNTPISGPYPEGEPDCHPPPDSAAQHREPRDWVEFGGGDDPGREDPSRRGGPLSDESQAGLIDSDGPRQPLVNRPPPERLRRPRAGIAVGGGRPDTPPEERDYQNREVISDSALAARVGVATPRNRTETVIDAGGLTLVGVSAQGSSHMWDNDPCQDAHKAAMTLDGHHLVAAIADGTSHGSRSGDGADLAVETAVRLTIGYLDRGETPLPVKEIVATVAADIRELAAQGPPLEAEEADAAYSTTLVVVVVETSPFLTDEGDAHNFLAFRVGDSGAQLLDGQGAWNPMFDDIDETVESAATAALPRSSDQLEARDSHLVLGEALVLMTDGIDKALVGPSGPTRVAAFLADVWRLPVPVGDFVLQAQFVATTFHDDRTAVAIWPAQGGGTQ